MTGRRELNNLCRPYFGRRGLINSHRPARRPTGINVADGNALDCCSAGWHSLTCGAPSHLPPCAVTPTSRKTRMADLVVPSISAMPLRLRLGYLGPGQPAPCAEPNPQTLRRKRKPGPGRRRFRRKLGVAPPPLNWPSVGLSASMNRPTAPDDLATRIGTIRWQGAPAADC